MTDNNYAKSSQRVAEWVLALPARYQGVLFSAIRGCDTAPKNDPSKLLARVYRGEILISAADPGLQPVSFIEYVDYPELGKRMTDFLRNWDHYPMHYVTHFIHAAEVVGRFHSDPIKREVWNEFYKQACKKLHMNPELHSEMERRLEADEETFGKNQQELVDAAGIEQKHLQITEKELIEGKKRCPKCGEIPCNCKWSGS